MFHGDAGWEKMLSLQASGRKVEKTTGGMTGFSGHWVILCHIMDKESRKKHEKTSSTF